MFLQMQLFSTLRFLMSSLESSWRILAHSNPKTDPKTDPKIDLKLTQNWTKSCSIFGQNFVDFLTILGGHFLNQKIHGQSAHGSESVVFQWENYIFCKNDMILMYNLRSMWYDCECALDLVLDPFLTNFGANLGSQNCSKNGPKIYFCWFHFWSHVGALFTICWGHFWVKKSTDEIHCDSESVVYYGKTTFVVEMTWFSCKL